MGQIKSCVETKKMQSPNTEVQNSLKEERDTTGLTTENTELKLRLQAMEQQAQLRDALNDALKKEVERLKIATGEIMTPFDTYNLGMHHIPYTQSAFFSQQPQLGPADHQKILMPWFNPFQSNMSSHHQPLLVNSHSFSQSLSEMLQKDPLGRLQGLDISSRGSHLVKSEGPSMYASESSSTFPVF